jgi:hypothetical protein
MTNKKTLYQNIKSELTTYQVKIKICKRFRPTKSWGKILEHIETLNILRFLNAYMYFVKHNGIRFSYKVKDCESVRIVNIFGDNYKRKRWENLDSNINRFLCTFVEFYNDDGLSMIKYNSPVSFDGSIPLMGYRESFFGIDKVIDVFCKIHEYNGENKDKFFTEKTEEFRKWFVKSHY